MKETNINSAIQIITKSIRKFRGVFSLTDASANTGLAIDEARAALDKILERYVCRLQVTENGDLIYNFGLPLKRRGRKSLGEILQSIGLALWKVFTVLFKIWITVMLVVYFVIFVILLVLLIIASSSSGRDRDNRGPSIGLGALGRMFFAIFAWNTNTGTVVYDYDNEGYGYRRYVSNRPVLSRNPENKKHLIASVYDFVFGPARVDVDPLSNEKEVAEYLRENKGVLTLSELVALAGWTFDQAEMRLADYVSRFKGDTEISENKIMYARFDRLIRSKSDYAGGKIVYYWDEYEPPFVLTGNSSGKNFFIILMNAFNLIMSLSVAFSHSMQHSIGSLVSGFGIGMPFIIITLGFIPAMFSLIFFLVPLLRMPFVLAEENRRKLANKRRRLIKVVFDRLDAENIKISDVKQALQKGREKLPPDDELRRMMDRIQVELRGMKDLTNDGKIAYIFSRIKYEYEEIKKIRQNIVINRDLGNIEIDM